jgi:bifunctional UDP-N-acetylglucosamine pyrophosphorylase / glucosamine-1-phosphate N-acetyltransferase
MDLSCIILAAGDGKRMKSALPKVLHGICGTTMLQSVVNTAEKLSPKKTIVVAGKHIDLIKKSIVTKDVLFVRQKEPKGTGHALQCARPELKGFKGTIVVLNGDSPLVRPETIRKFLRLHNSRNNTVSVLSFTAEDPAAYGRVVRNVSGEITAIVEDRDADKAEKKINEVNSGVYALRHEALYLLNEIRMNRTKGEYYLTDIISLSIRKGLKTSAFCIGTENEFMGVNTKEELCRAAYMMRKGIIKKWSKNDVTFVGPDSVFIGPEVLIGGKTTIYPNVYIEGKTRIGRGATIYPNVRISNCGIGRNVTIKDSTVMEDSVIRDGAIVGPFAHLRPGTEVGSGARIGNFVELKKAHIGNKTKASHLSYIGDAKIGKDVNIGAGTITCNYDGEKKHTTVIGNGVFVGSDTQLIAPVKIGKGAYIGAGSTITVDVPPGALAISRVRQKNLPGWAKRRAEAGSRKPEVRKGKEKK